MMEDETVRKRKWISCNQFLEFMAIVNILPGPNATKMAMHLGYFYAGFPGLIIAGICFLLPATIISLVIAIIYTQLGSLPLANEDFLYIHAVVVAILISALFRLSKSVYKLKFSLLLGGGSLIAAFLKCDQVLIMIFSGFICMFYNSVYQGKAALLIIGLISFKNVLYRLESMIQPKLVQLGLFFLKAGGLLFGGTYILLAFLQTDLINKFNWITEQQVIDAIAVGQITPGPVLSTATFIGYVIAGFPGAIVSTIGTFLPSFFIVFFTTKYFPKINHLKSIKYFLDGITVSAVSLLAFAIFNLMKSILFNPTAILLTFVALILLYKYKVNALWLILSGALLSLFKFLIGGLL